MDSRFSPFFLLVLAVSSTTLVAAPASASPSAALSAANQAAGYDVITNKAFGDEVRDKDVVVLNADHLFEAFKKRFRKSYLTQEEQDYRFSVFKDNLKLARLHQKVDPSAVPKVSRFFDMTAAEIQDRHKLPRQKFSNVVNVEAGDDALISQVAEDSRTNHVVNAEQLFEAFQRKFGKSYYSQEEHDYRFTVFESNLRRLRKQEKLHPLEIHYLTRYLDLTPTELRLMHLA